MQSVVVQTPANEGQGSFSLDGHWVAKISNESSLSEIYMNPLPHLQQWQMPGVERRWRAAAERQRAVLHIAELENDGGGGQSPAGVPDR